MLLKSVVYRLDYWPLILNYLDSSFLKSHNSETRNKDCLFINFFLELSIYLKVSMYFFYLETHFLEKHLGCFFHYRFEMLSILIPTYIYEGVLKKNSNIFFGYFS